MSYNNTPKRVQLPSFEGYDADDKLRQLCKWATKNLADGYCLTLDEIGKGIGLTRERVRQIEARALRKLRHPSRMKKIDEN